ncbi:MAG: hypothetical protein H6625_02245 [Bdellovibrionaceae bacterium]|nr:hypothetical protein [Pseudobdellovibrionaceae bacterium]
MCEFLDVKNQIEILKSNVEASEQNLEQYKKKSEISSNNKRNRKSYKKELQRPSSEIV